MGKSRYRVVALVSVVALACSLPASAGLSARSATDAAIASRAASSITAAVARFDSGPYSVILLTNVASPGNIFVGLISYVKGKFTCNFTDGGLCAGAGGANVPVTFTEPLGSFSSCSAALVAYHQHTMGQHPAFGGQKIYFDTAPIPSPAPSTPPSTSVSYFIDNTSLWCTGGSSAPPTTSTATAKPHLFTRGDLRRNKAYRTFFGLDDPISSNWGSMISDLCTGLVSHAVNYPNVTSDANIPGQTTFGQHSASVFGNSDFHDLLDSSLPASELTDNVFVNATKPFEPQLRNLIASSSGDLTPADVLDLALQATNGSYPMAVLTTLNLLKDVTFEGRDAATQASRLVNAHPVSDAAITKENELYQKEISILTTQDQVVGKLISLRQNPLLAQDKMGPWYHAFTILTVSALSPLPIPRGNATAFWEHFRKAIGVFGTSEAPFNPEKATLDFCFAQSADTASMLGISRHH